MRHLTFKFAMVSLAAIALTSCSKEQSSLNIEDIPGKAKVMGTLAYNAGQGYADGAYTQIIKVASGVRVAALIENSTLTNTGNAEGVTTYETTTDENGNYTIEVPALDQGTTVKIIADPFFDTYSEVVGIEDKQPKIESKEVLYKLNDRFCQVTPNDIEIYDGTFYFGERDILEAAPYNSTFIVKVAEGRYTKQKDEYGDDQIVRKYEVVKDKEVLVKIGEEQYAAITNSLGEAKFVIPSEYKDWETEAAITVQGYVEKNYPYYVEEYSYIEGDRIVTSHIIENGIFRQYENIANIQFESIEGAPVPTVKVRMIFVPFEDEETYGYDANDWIYTSWED